MREYELRDSISTNFVDTGYLDTATRPTRWDAYIATNIAKTEINSTWVDFNKIAQLYKNIYVTFDEETQKYIVKVMTQEQEQQELLPVPEDDELTSLLFGESEVKEV